MKPEYAQSIINSVEESYDTIAEHFSETRQAPWPEFNLLQAHITQNHSEQAIATNTPIALLDIGCGNGRLARDIQPANSNVTVDYTGSDISSELIQLAQQQNPNDHFVVANMAELPFADNTFDIITAIASLQHIPSRALRITTLKEFGRVAKPGATVFMTNWNLYQPHMPDYQQYAKDAFGEEWEEGDTLVPWRNAQGDHQAMRYYHAYTAKNLSTELELAGWNNVQHTYWARGKECGPLDGFNIVTTCSISNT